MSLPVQTCKGAQELALAWDSTNVSSPQIQDKQDERAFNSSIFPSCWDLKSEGITGFKGVPRLKKNCSRESGENMLGFVAKQFEDGKGVLAVIRLERFIRITFCWVFIDILV